MVSLTHEKAARAELAINRACADQSKKLKCKNSKSAWRRAGRPRSGPAYQQMKVARNDVKTYVRSSRAKMERKVIQARDNMFRERDERRFDIYQKKTQCRKLVVDGNPIIDEAELLSCWKNHFSNLAHSQTREAKTECDDYMVAMSHGYEDFILDYDFTEDEIEYALKRLKSNKSGGADGLVTEHLKHGGHSIVSWLRRILNRIIQLEKIPPSFKLGVITPVFKGKGRDPLDCNNYRGITLTSVLAKCLEILVLSRLEFLFCEKGFPTSSQTAYQKGLSCIDAIFSTQEVILKHIREGDTPYLCFFDLEKAFDSVEYSTLLTNIFNLGINGKCFRLIKDWYTDTRSIVRVNNQCSQSFPIHRGVKQGSVLSPLLFIVVIDSLLSYLASSGLGLKVSGLNVGFSAHADDVRAASNSIIDTQTQGKLIASFCSANNLKLNVSNKTELVQFTSGRVTASTHNIAGQTIHTQPEAKCLGVWWRYNLSPARSVHGGTH